MVRVYGWETGFNKVSFNKLLRSHSSLSLSEAHEKVGLLLDGTEISIKVEDELEDEFRAKAREIGALVD